MILTRCDDLVTIAIFVRGTSAVDGSYQRLTEAIEVADCCRQKERFDLATELLDLIESCEIGRKPPFVELVHEQRIKVAKKDRSGNPQQIPAEPPRTPLPPDLPPLIVEGFNLAGSLFRWVAAGFPVSTKEEIKRRGAICRACPNFVNERCRLCGCCSSDEVFYSKLVLGSEVCPDNPPRW